jgi:hypothetical protein
MEGNNMRKGNGNQEEHHGDVNMPVQALTEPTLAVDLARAEIDQAIATAHRYPRMLDTVIKKIRTLACYNEQAAENCIYSLPRGGKPILGATIGFANIVASSWGNCSAAARIVYVDRREKIVVAEGAFHDLESNSRTIVPVTRRIVDKQGRVFNDDMIAVTQQAAVSIARRNAILSAIPKAMWFPIYEECLQIVRGDVETFAERKAKALKAFHQFGVKPEQIYGALGLKGDADLTLEHMPYLRGMYSALKDGSETVETLFDPRRMTGTNFETVNNPLGEEETVDQETGEIKAVPKQERRGRPRKQKEVEIEAVGKSEPTAEPKSPQESPMHANLPHNAEEYRHHLAGWLMAATDAAEIEKQWRAERDMRGNAGVIEESFEQARSLKDERISQLTDA